MNSEFPKIITEQRKLRKLSQKQVAADLGISQALLSHYEKGIRECGLDFVVKIADYYNVSCDLLLGREQSTHESTGCSDIAKTAELILSHFKQNEASDFLMLNLYKLLCMTNHNDSLKLNIPKLAAENLTDSVIMNISAAIKLKSGEASQNDSDLSECPAIKNLISLSERKISEFHKSVL